MAVSGSRLPYTLRKPPRGVYLPPCSRLPTPETRSVVFAYSGDTARNKGPDHGIANRRHFSIALRMPPDSECGVTHACSGFLCLRMSSPWTGVGRSARVASSNLSLPTRRKRNAASRSRRVRSTNSLPDSQRGPAVLGGPHGPIRRLHAASAWTRHRPMSSALASSSACADSAGVGLAAEDAFLESWERAAPRCRLQRIPS